MDIDLKKLIGFFLLGLFIFTFLSYFFMMILSFDSIELDKKDTFIFTSRTVENINVNLSSQPLFLFCPQDDCFEEFERHINLASKSLYCSFYDLTHPGLIRLINNKAKQINVELIIDDRNLDRRELSVIDFNNIRLYSDVNRNTLYNNYIHHKFCVIDEEIVITGSANPTINGFHHNNNFIFIINSSNLASNYINEFNQLASGVFGYNKRPALAYNKITYSYGNSSFYLENYFCPQNRCLDRILEKLRSANNEIVFASYVITQNDIEDTLIDRSKEIVVRGVVERKFINVMGSRVTELLEIFPIILYDKSNNMHHKYFVIDDEIVIFGSANPSNSGVRYNDENIIIIKDRNVAKLFKIEFDSLFYG